MKTEKSYQEGKSESKPPNENLWDLINACRKNVLELIQDSEILLFNKRFQRAYALAFTALEELGKYLIVCDYYNGSVSKKEFEKAFYHHGIKPGYLFNKLEFSEESPLMIVYDEKKFEQYFQLRNNAMYVGWNKKTEGLSKPEDQIDKENARFMIDLVKKQVSSIQFAENLNGRIGSKALYK